MPNETTLIATIAIAFVGALLMGLLAARLRLPPIVGYLVAGIAMHALAPETVPIGGVASQASELGVVLLMFGVGLVVFGLSVAVQYGLAHVPANRAIVIMLFELVVAALAAYFLAGEAMTTREWIGGAMIISASLFSSRMNRA